MWYLHQIKYVYIKSLGQLENCFKYAFPAKYNTLDLKFREKYKLDGEYDKTTNKNKWKGVNGPYTHKDGGQYYQTVKHVSDDIGVVMQFCDDRTAALAYQISLNKKKAKASYIKEIINKKILPKTDEYYGNEKTYFN